MREKVRPASTAGESEKEREREVKWEKVEKQNSETRIDDVATLYNHWIKSMVDIRTIARDMNHGCFAGYFLFNLNVKA